MNREGDITLIDKDPDVADPTVILGGIDSNRGNKRSATPSTGCTSLFDI